MKTKLITALMACLSAIVIFSSCKDDDKEDAKQYYAFTMELTDPGDMDAASASILRNILEEMGEEVYATEGEVKGLFNQMVAKIEAGLPSIPVGEITKPVSFKLSVTQKSSGKVINSKTFTIQPE